MIYCKKCKKFARLKTVFINGMDEVKVRAPASTAASTKRNTYPKGTIFSEIPDSKIDYTDFEELGINR